MLFAEITGEPAPVPLSECEWVMWGPCGCPVGAALAVRFPTAEAMWREWYPRKRDRERAQTSRRLELMTRTRASAEVFPLLATPCPHTEETP